MGFFIATAAYGSFAAFVFKKKTGGQEVYLLLKSVFIFSSKSGSSNLSFCVKGSNDTV